MSTSLSLYEIEDRYLALANTEDIVSAEQQQEFQAELAEALRSATVKRDRVAHFLLACKHHEDAIDTEVKRLQALKKTWETGRKRMEKYVVAVIEGMGTDDKGKYQVLKGETSTLRVQRNPSSVVITDEAAVPVEFKSATVTLPATLWQELQEELDLEVFQRDVNVRLSVEKSAVKEAIDHGVDVSGADISFGELRLVVK